MPRLTISLILLMLATAAIADTTITYQGQLRQADQPYSGTANLEFRLFDQLAGGTQIGPAQTINNAPVTDGLFQAELDFGADAFSAQVRYLEVRVDGTALTPRQAIRPAPMALFALGGNEGPPGPEGTSPFTLNEATGKIEYEFDDQVIRFEPLRDSQDSSSPAIAMGSAFNAASAAGAVVAGGGNALVPNLAGGLYSTVSGGFGNTASVFGSTVSGGLGNTASASSSTVGGGEANTVSDFISTVSGGFGNTASGVASTVSGGEDSTASGNLSTVGGGSFNWASGLAATIPGGVANRAQGDYAFAAGRRAKADHNGTFVWADSIDTDFPSERANQFRVRATGGADFETGTRGLQAFSNSSSSGGAAIQGESVHPDGIAITGRNDSTDATLVLNNRGTGRLIRAFSGGTQLLNLENNGNLWIAGTLSQGSDRDQKEAFEPVDADDVLDRLAGLDISSWRYLRSDDGVRHIGPMAQDFHAAFGFGVSDTTISTIDAQGIAFAAIQALNQRLINNNAELRRNNEELATRLTALEALILEGGQMAGKAP